MSNRAIKTTESDWYTARVNDDMGMMIYIEWSYSEEPQVVLRFDRNFEEATMDKQEAAAVKAELEFAQELVRQFIEEENEAWATDETGQ
jgi:hypothetical protein